MKPLSKIELRGNDPTGAGWYGAKRGSRKHKGLDLVAKPGTPVMSPINGHVSKIGYPYAGNLDFRYVEITGETYRVRLMYVRPLDTIKKDDRVFIGDKIGIAQDISSYWNPNMKNHIHLEVYKNGLLTDPEPLITV